MTIFGCEYQCDLCKDTYVIHTYPSPKRPMIGMGGSWDESFHDLCDDCTDAFLTVLNQRKPHKSEPIGRCYYCDRLVSQTDGDLILMANNQDRVPVHRECEEPQS